MRLPKMTLCRQIFPHDAVAKPAEALTSLIHSGWISEKVRPGQTVAVTGGRLDFGPWEQIFYGEFDGGRRKRALVKIIGE